LNRLTYFIFLLVFFISCTSNQDENAQELILEQADILLKNGHVIDPKNHFNEPMDVAIVDGKILRVAKNISEKNVEEVINIGGMYVTPGLINMHTHVYAGDNPGFQAGISSIFPDVFSFRSGTTTVVDAGTSGWRNFPDFKEKIIDVSRTRVLAFLSIAATGFSNDDKYNYEMDPVRTAQMVDRYPELIGVRIGHFNGNEWLQFDLAVEAAEKSDTPLLVECHLPEYPLEGQLNRMRSGDILTHAFEHVSEREPVVNVESGFVENYVLEAQKKGVLFDVGHGGAGFWFSQAIPALEQGLLPDSFGTDQHRFSMNAGMKDMLNVMSKYLNLGMSLENIINSATWKPANSIQRPDLGHLSEGAVADLAVLNIRRGEFGFVDAGNNKIEGNRKFEAELTIRAGNIVWDLNGLSAVPFEESSDGRDSVSSGSEILVD
jgi:dihydroorotase